MIVATSAVARHHRSDGHAISFVGGRGGHVRDSEGRDYVDLVCGFGPVVVGHADPEWTEIVAASMGRGVHLPGYGPAHEELASLYARPGQQVGYFKHSSDAVTAAVRMACTDAGTLAFLRCGYLGWHDALIAGTPRWHEPLTSHARSQVRYGNGFRGVGGAEAPTDWVDLELETLRELLDGPRRMACLAVDAYQAELRPAGWLEEAFRLCREHGVRTILDETKTACRVGPSTHLDGARVAADYTVLGKAVANGVALSLLLGPADMSRAYELSRISGTFSKDLMSVWAGLATASVMRDRDATTRLPAAGRHVVDAFNRAAVSEGLDEVVEAVPVLGGGLWELRWAQRIQDDLALRGALPRAAADHGVLLLQGHPSFVALAHADADADSLVESFSNGLRTWASNGAVR